MRVRFRKKLSCLILSGSTVLVSTLLLNNASYAAETTKHVKKKHHRSTKQVMASNATPSAVSPSAMTAEGTSEPWNIRASEAYPRSWLIPGTDSRMKIYGMISVLGRYDATDAPDFDFIKMFGIYPNNNPNGSGPGHFGISARNSILGVETKTQTSMLGQIDTKLELGFESFGVDNRDAVAAPLQNNYSIALYQGYVSFKDTMLGQTFSNFIDVMAMPETLNFTNNAGVTLILQPQARHTWNFGSNILSAALESNESDFTYGGLSVTPTSTGGPIFAVNPESNVSYGTDASLSRFPDVTLAFTHNANWGHVFVSGVARDIRMDVARSTLTNNMLGCNATFNPTGAAICAAYPAQLRSQAFGWALNGAARINTFGKDNILLKYTYGNGVGRYLLFGLYSGALVMTNGNLSTQDMGGGYASYQHWWTDALRTNLTYGMLHVATPEVNGSIWKKFQSVNINLMWSPFPALTTGVEYFYAYDKFANNSIGAMSRFMLGVNYAF
ncbi:MAG: hypothetical protein A3E85_03335 [Gammaproteobacteria bacterium RIFCSPHIGHO2_12_FULL_45_12]|nr:MAG: hypothetical protein A3E85_03335 [Gammaproteobacteria bacterium RIFCSPHIGHO2_12_FULL_45_12]